MVWIFRGGGFFLGKEMGGMVPGGEFDDKGDREEPERDILKHTWECTGVGYEGLTSAGPPWLDARFPKK